MSIYIVHIFLQSSDLSSNSFQIFIPIKQYQPFNPQSGKIPFCQEDQFPFSANGSLPNLQQNIVAWLREVDFGTALGDEGGVDFSGHENMLVGKDDTKSGGSLLGNYIVEEVFGDGASGRVLGGLGRE